MLLRHTPNEITERSALMINPAKTCQPIGAMYAALGIHGCLPHSHGSQGCCAYHRSTLTRHYKEPVMAGTSSFTEGASVFGGQANLVQAIINIFSVYEPEVIAVHTTCLSETEIKRLCRELGVASIMFPDTSNVLNTPQTGKYSMYPAGGVTVADLMDTGNSMGTVALGPLASGPAARALDTKCKVPCEILDLPSGLQA
ncbi:MAG: nitrogenase component 1, partial [Syntrophobacterales bacterium]